MLTHAFSHTVHVDPEVRKRKLMLTHAFSHTRQPGGEETQANANACFLTYRTRRPRGEVRLSHIHVKPEVRKRKLMLTHAFSHARRPEGEETQGQC